MNNQYEVLSPWAEIDPITLRGISPRVTELSGRKIGLFCNYKRAAPAILNAVEQRLKERFPTCQTSRYVLPQMVTAVAPNIIGMKPEDRAGFDEWLKGVDAVIAAVGD